jgi:hypothetical protein
MTKVFTLCVLCALAGSVVFAQNYRCDWNVVGLGGGDMSSASYRAGTTVGQTAIGIVTSTNYQGFIGFWQIDTAASGIREDEHWTVATPLVTRLFDPAPNPGPGNALIRYSLATETHVTLRLFDLTGRNVRSLVNARQKPGNYRLRISDFATPGSRFGRGVFFLKFRTDDYLATAKLVLTE